MRVTSQNIFGNPSTLIGFLYHWFLEFSPGNFNVGFEVLTAVLVKISIFWDMTLQKVKYVPVFLRIPQTES